MVYTWACFHCSCIFVELINVYSDDIPFLTHLYHQYFCVLPKNRRMHCFPKSILHTLAVIRLTLILGKDDVAKYVGLTSIPFIQSFTELTSDEGIPPDWCSTILNYVLAVHCRLIKIDANAAYLLRNYLFKNFAYKLRGSKRVCIMVTFFAGLQYDFVSIEETPDILNIGEYLLTKFVCDKYLRANKLFSEYRVYFCVACIVMADLYKEPLLLSAAIFENTHAGYIAEFFRAIKRAIESTVTQDQQKQCEHTLDPKYSRRWKTAIVYSRLFDETAPVTECVERWRGMIRSIENLN